MDEPRFRALAPIRPGDGSTRYEFRVQGDRDYVRLTDDQAGALTQWCHETCVDWADRDKRFPRWTSNLVRWTFTDARDALAFKVRWC